MLTLTIIPAGACNGDDDEGPLDAGPGDESDGGSDDPRPVDPEGAIRMKSGAALPGVTAGFSFGGMRTLDSDEIAVPGLYNGNVFLVHSVVGDVRTIEGFEHDSATAPQASQGPYACAPWHLENALFVIDGASRSLEVADLRSRAIVRGAELQGAPRDLEYAVRTSELWITEPEDRRIATRMVSGEPDAPVIDADRFIELPFEPDGLALGSTAEPNRQVAFVTTPDAGELGVIGLDSRDVEGRWPVECAATAGKPLVDDARGQVFVACATQAKVCALDMWTGSAIGCYELDEPGAGQIAWSKSKKRLYVRAAHGGTLAKLAVDDDQLWLVGTTSVPADAQGLVASERFPPTLWLGDGVAGELLQYEDGGL